MKKFFAVLFVSALVSAGCQSVETAKVDPSTIASNGEAVALVQCTALGLTLLFHFVTITEASLDTVVNKMMVAEAKALGANRVQVIQAWEMPKSGLLFHLAGGVISWVAGGPSKAMASGVAVR